MTVPHNRPPAEVHIDEIRHLLDEAKARPLTEVECDQILGIAMSYCQVGEMLADRTATIAKLRKMLFGTSSEKTNAVLGSRAAAAATTTAASGADGSGDATASAPAQKGHGRNGAAAYRSATRTRILLESMKAGDKCPECPKGVLYKMAEPAVMVRVFGGFAAANIAVWAIGATDVNRQVLLLYGALPAAVINFVLTEKYRQDPALAASIVVLSTFLSVLTIPIVFWLIL